MENARLGLRGPHIFGVANITAEPKSTQNEADIGTAGRLTASWVTAARAGAQQAYAALYRHYLPLVHGLLLARHPPSIADELCQDCFALAFQRLEQLRDPACFGPWIARIARHLRRPARIELPLDSIPEPQTQSGCPEQRSEALAMLEAVLALPLAYRETLLLRLVEGLSGAEIAAQTGLGADSVRVNLHRGLRLLRQRLALSSHGALTGQSVQEGRK